jgi:hypothetical protein
MDGALAPGTTAYDSIDHLNAIFCHCVTLAFVANT